MEIIQIKSRIFSIDKKKELIHCDCILDEKTKIFEKRVFPKYLFDNIINLKVGSFVIVKMTKNIGSLLIEIFDSKDVIDEKDFEIQDLWNF